MEVFTHVRLAPQWIALVIAVIAVESAAAAPRLLCYAVTPGETVTAISVRLTGNPQSWRGNGFQVFDPAVARFVPKSDYGRIHPRWHACVVEPSLALSTVPGIGWWVVLLVCSAAAAVAALIVIQSSIERRKAASRALEQFGSAFIREFERPLLEERIPRSKLRAKLELAADRRSIDVLIAPPDGKRYPNLGDHRTNVEYDVGRVVGLLNDRRFVCGPLRARGPWVAIPFRLVLDLRKEGGT